MLLPSTTVQFEDSYVCPVNPKPSRNLDTMYICALQSKGNAFEDLFILFPMKIEAVLMMQCPQLLRQSRPIQTSGGCHYQR